ncbi:hypothetical protein PFISCL1PPCAC_11246, partial [Pristionchus fissidentatus]
RDHASSRSDWQNACLQCRRRRATTTFDLASEAPLPPDPWLISRHSSTPIDPVCRLRAISCSSHLSSTENCLPTSLLSSYRIPDEIIIICVCACGNTLIFQ